jgi:N-methylhydantoinase A/oxoprolinase/acetone carboxylase beta subunit
LILGSTAIKYPVFTFSSGPTNSLRGASELTKIKNGIVVDIGGTSTDVAQLENGFPRPASAYVNVGGVRTNFRMPDTYCIALGGGSIVKFAEDGSVKIGPQSVGYKLKKEAKCFGGNILTTTDVALAAGVFDIEGADKTKIGLEASQVETAMKEILRMVEEAVDMIKTSAGDQPVILVGGGSALIPTDSKFKGIEKLVKPPHFGCANALGAAIAQVSGTVDKVVNSAGKSREEILEGVKNEAIELAVKNGAVRESIETIPDEIPVQYVEGIVRFIVKAIGELNVQNLAMDKGLADIDPAVIASLKVEEEAFVEEIRKESDEDDNIEIPMEHNFEMIDGKKNWVMTNADLDCLKEGCGILGAGGGASPYLTSLVCKSYLKQGYKLRVIAHEDMGEDEYGICGAFLGAPTVGIEKVTTGNEIIEAISTITSLKSEADKKVTCVLSCEIGGMNSVAPLYAAAKMGLPMVDADGMGRAFP